MAGRRERRVHHSADRESLAFIHNPVMGPNRVPPTVAGANIGFALSCSDHPLDAQNRAGGNIPPQRNRVPRKDSNDEEKGSCRQ